MTSSGWSFGWKRKAGAKISKSAVQSFSAEAKDDDEENGDADIDWLTLAPKRRIISLEDAVSKSERLKTEGALLAEAERFWEAIKKWDEALQLTPSNEKILEMKAQALMAVGEVFPAVQIAQKTVDLAPNWWVCHQTLGRALTNIGEVKLALKSFSRAVHLNPSDKELWMEDLYWTKSLLERQKVALERDETPRSSVTVTEIKDDNSLDCSDEEEGEGREMSVMHYQRGSSGQSDDASNHYRNLKRLPNNYVKMRDPT